jgi:hypothetical protein
MLELSQPILRSGYLHCKLKMIVLQYYLSGFDINVSYQSKGNAWLLKW